MRIAIVSLIVGMACSITPVLAQNATTPTFAIGDKVLGPQQKDVGTIVRIDGDNIVVNTGKHEAALAKSSFAKWPSGLVIGSTRDQLDAAVEQAAAKNKADLAAALVSGAEAKSLNGIKVLGKVKELEADFVLLATPDGDLRVPRSAFVLRPAGLTIGLTVEQFDKAVKKVLPASGH